MSLMRRLSRRMSGSGRKTNQSLPLPSQTPSSSQAVVAQPTERTLTTANLFNPNNTTAGQSTNMDRTLYEIPQPVKVDAMTDLVRDHEPGTFFPYVGVVGSEGEGSDARRARMLALKPSYNRRDIPEIIVSGCPLISREGDFTMNALMSFAKQNSDPVKLTGGLVPNGNHNKDYTMTKPYVHIRQITILFTPNVSSTSNYCNLWMNLVDNRLIDSDRGSQTNVVVSNQESIMEMSCDYCVSIADLGAFTLTYTLERDIVHPGFQWGTASFYFSITEADLPYQTSKIESMGVYRMPITTLMSRNTNADKSDISFTPADIVKLRELYSSGDIVDVDEPKTARLKTNSYSKSSIRSKPKGEKLDVSSKPGWEFMEGGRKPKVDAMVASVDPDDESYDLPEVDTEAAKRNREETLRMYRERQDREREMQEKELANFSGSLSTKGESIRGSSEVPEQPDPADELAKFFSKKDKKVMFGPSGA
jgi:hypothetical protein